MSVQYTIWYTIYLINKMLKYIKGLQRLKNNILLWVYLISREEQCSEREHKADLLKIN